MQASLPLIIIHLIVKSWIAGVCLSKSRFFRTVVCFGWLADVDGRLTGRLWGRLLKTVFSCRQHETLQSSPQDLRRISAGSQEGVILIKPWLTNTLISDNTHSIERSLAMSSFSSHRPIWFDVDQNHFTFLKPEFNQSNLLKRLTSRFWAKIHFRRGWSFQKSHFDGIACYDPWKSGNSPNQHR
jgi:hypothetical protein